MMIIVDIPDLDPNEADTFHDRVAIMKALRKAGYDRGYGIVKVYLPQEQIFE